MHRFISEQPPYHILDRRIERELVPMSLTCRVGLLPWSPLAGGLPTGKYRRNEALPAGSRYTRHLAQHTRMVDDVFRVTEGLEAHIRQKGGTMSQFALAWVMHQPGTTSTIIGPRTFEQLEDNLGVLEVDVTPEDCQLEDTLVPPGTMVAPFYEADFGPGAFRW